MYDRRAGSVSLILGAAVEKLDILVRKTDADLYTSNIPKVGRCSYPRAA
jgi:hypothetical protein